jgi:hypothetical protein
MSHEYAMSRVRDALEKSENNHLKAQRLILNWIEKDQTLLFGLVSPHMQGIISHAINHELAPKGKKTPKTFVPDAEEGGDEFGGALMRGVRSENASFGEATPRGIGKPGKASQKHVDAINALVSAGKGKDKGGKKK